MIRVDTPEAAAGLSSMLALEDAPGHLIRRAQQRHTQLWSEEFAGALTGPQYAVLCAVAMDGGAAQREVGERASLDTSTMSDIVTRLAAQGWLRLDRDPIDKRRKCVELTVPARAALTATTRQAALVQERLLEPVPSMTRHRFVDAMRLVAYRGVVPPPTADGGGLSLTNTPGHLIRRCQQVHTVAWAAEVGAMLTAPQYAVLSALWDHPDGINQSTAGQRAALDKSSMADVVARLAQRGWITRTRDPADGRFQLLCLTAAVRSDVPAVTAAVRRVQDSLLAPLVQKLHRAAFMAGFQALAVPLDQRVPGAGP